MQRIRHWVLPQADAEGAQEASESRIGVFGEELETGFYADGLSLIRHLDRIGMTAEARLLFDQGDILIVLKHPRDRKTGDTAANHADAHTIPDANARSSSI